MGRSSDFSEETAEAIVTRLMEGESLVAICKGEGMPHRNTVLRWQVQHEDFGARCARAREAQAHAVFDDMQEIADKATPENVQVAKVRISTMQWRASKLAPKVYGDKLELSGDPNRPLAFVSMSDDELARIAAGGS